jgi:8-oxo-dGTP pyrophosphatase MutT (NUDIX family)
VAGFFFCPRTGRVLLHQRDGKTDINPHKWAFFTGLVENYESPLTAILREVKEEIGYSLTDTQAQEIDRYLNEERQTIRHVFLINVETEFYPRKVHEGAGVGWHTLSEALQLDVTTLTKYDLEKFAATR